MIVYGTKATELNSENLTEKCPNCDNRNTIGMTVFQKYAHVFWIPFFPIGKTGASVCSHCKQALMKKEFNSDLNERYDTMKGLSKTPAWTFSGLILFSALVAYGVFSSKQTDAKNAQIIVSPLKNDIYEIKKGPSQYTIYKVADVVGDTVMLKMHQFETNKSTGIDGLKKDDSYEEDALVLVKSDLKAMLDKGEIMDIDRK